LAVERKGEEEMLPLMQKFWQDESGQDLIEYTLLMAFVALASASLFLSAGNSIKGMWSGASSQLVAANTAS
jgi:Flp pilus assembly pilin Flp